MNSIPASGIITIGVDPHPGSHTAAALDSNGRCLGSIRVVNDAEGREKLKRWAERFSAHRWAVEGTGNSYIYPLVSDCLGQGEQVFAITPNLTSQYRNRGNDRKDDETDAVNAARALLANPKLPAYRPFVAQRQAQQLTRQQRRLSKQLKANRMALKELTDPSLKPALAAVIKALKQALAELAKQLATLVKQYAAPLLKPLGIGPLVAGMVLAEVGLVSRFRSRDAFAAYAGPPLPNSQGAANGCRSITKVIVGSITLSTSLP